MAKIADAENLRLAFWKAAKGKRGTRIAWRSASGWMKTSRHWGRNC
jgi:hypothetical protein